MACCGGQGEDKGSEQTAGQGEEESSPPCVLV